MQNHKKNKSVPSASTNSRSIRMRQIENTNSFSMSTTSILVEEYRTYSISGETTEPFPNNLVQEKPNGIFYLQPGLDIGYLKNTNGGWDVFLYKPIKIYHDISTSGRWGGQVVLTIERDWKMTLTFSTPDGWTIKNQDIYGRMTIETDLMNVSDPMKNNLNIRRYEVGTPKGRYYKIAGPGVRNVNVTITQTNTTRVIDGRSVLNVRNLYDIIRVDAEFIGYYGNVKQSNMFIKFFDTVGIRVPSRIPYFSNKLSAPFNPPSIISIDLSKRNDNLIVDISDYVTFETTTNGMIDVKIVTPFTIYYDLSIPGAWGGQMITTIDKKWNIVTTYQTQDAWPNSDNNSTVTGDLRIEANINEENNINTGDENVVNVYSRIRNSFSRYTQNVDTLYNADNFIYLSRTIWPFTRSHGLYYNKETLSFRNLDNLVRIYTDMVSHDFVNTLNDKMKIKNTLTLMCKYNDNENKKAYFSVSKPPTLIKNSIQIDNLEHVFTIPNSAAGYYDIDLDPQLNAYSPIYFYRDEPDNRFTINVTNVSIKDPKESDPKNIIDATEIKKHVNLDNNNILRLKMLDSVSVFQIKSCELTAIYEPDIFSGYKILSRIKLTWKILNMRMTIIIEPM